LNILFVIAYGGFSLLALIHSILVTRSAAPLRKVYGLMINLQRVAKSDK